VTRGVKCASVFLMHQFLGTWGVAVFAYFAGSSIFDLAYMFGRNYSMRSLHWILTETPFFPAQVVLGLYSGWKLNGWLKHRSMLYVWILPALILFYCLIAEPNLTSQNISVLARNENSLSHYFGWGCQPRDHCLDQLLVTMPFYAATAYSIGAWLSLSLKFRVR